MKKIFTLAAATLIAAGAYAQTGVTKVEKTMVMYTTNDTITSQMGLVEDPDTGEEVEEIVGKYWTGGDMVNGFNACGMPLSGTSTTQTQYKVTTRQDYVDAQTGFNMPAGSYRGVFIDGTISLTGALGSGKVNGYSNVKSMVLYFIPIPTTWVPAMGISHQDYPTGRVQAKYVSVAEDGTVAATSNQGYREIHIDETADPRGLETEIIKGVELAGFSRTVENPLDITIDRPIRLEVNLQNKLDGTAYEGIFENAETKQSEFANVVCENGTNDYEMSLYFADPATCDPYYDSTDAYKYASASGYDCFGRKWGNKVEWTPETIIQLAVKKRLYLVGMAIVSATDGAPSQFMNASEGLKASWSDSAKAFGHYGEAAAIKTVNAENAKVAPRKQLINGQIVIGNYNVMGQRVK